MMRRFSVLAVLALSLASGAQAHEEKLEGSEWGFVGDNGALARFVSFAGEQRLFGFAGCNRVSGDFKQDGNALTVVPLAMTKKACPPEDMKREDDFLTLLAKVRGIHVEHTMLMLLDENGAQLTTLMRRGTE